MNLGVFLNIGESFDDYRKKGQYDLIAEYLLSNYSRNFEKVFVFSYADEKFTIFNNVCILPNKWRLNRFFYSILAPFLYRKEIQSCSVLRGLQLAGGIPCLIANMVFDKPYVINYGYEYDHFARIEGKWLQWFLYKVIHWPILYFATKIIVTASYLKTSVKPFTKKNNIVLIPNGVDTSQFIPRKLRKINDVLFIGRLETQKNIHTLLEAVHLYKKKLRITIVGTGSQKQALQKLAQAYGVDCLFKGTVQHNKLPVIFNQSKIFVLPSLLEGNPKVLLEAFACGLPVIASNIDAHRDIIQSDQNGILCKPEAQSLAVALQNVMKNTILQTTFGINARRTAVMRFSKERLNKKEIAVLYSAAQS